MRLPIFICDDDAAFLNNYQRIINNAIIINGYEMEIMMATTDITDILDYLKKNTLTDSLFLLDIDLGRDFNGIDAAEVIRNENKFAQIAFITSHQELAFETIKRQIGALDYILKGDDEKHQIEAFLEDRNKDFHINRPQETHYFKLMIGSREIKINVDAIYYIETSVMPHKVCLYGEGIMYEFYSTLNELEKLYPELYRAHKSFLINPKKIVAVDYKKREILFPEEYVCHFPVTKVKAIKQL